VGGFLAASIVAAVLVGQAKHCGLRSAPSPNRFRQGHNGPLYAFLTVSDPFMGACLGFHNRGRGEQFPFRRN